MKAPSAAAVRKWAPRFILAWVGVAAILVCVAGLSLAQAKSDVDALRDANSEDLSSGQLEERLNSAASSLNRAHLSLDNPIVGVFRITPFLGRQLTSVTDIAEAGSKVAVTGAQALEDGRQLTERTDADRQQLLNEIASISADATASLSDLELGPKVGLVGPLADVRDELSEQVTSVNQTLQRVEGAALGAGQLFDNDGRYLVIASNNAEMRSGSGMFLSAGILETGGGNISLGPMQTFTERNVAPRQWPPELEQLWGWLGRQGDMRNLMLSPRFEVSALIAADIWQDRGFGSVDGVIAVDPVMLQAVIAATGQVQIDDVTVRADNVLSYLMFEQYQNLDGSDVQQEARREVLSEVAGLAFGALNEGQWDPVTLARQLASAANGRHLMVWSRNSDQQQLWQQAGVDGGLEGNSIMLSSVNVGGNKIDQFIDVDAQLSQVTGMSGLDMQVEVTVTNNSPTSGAGYVVGPYPGTDFVAGQYRSVLAVSLPGDARSVSFGDEEQALVAGPDGETKMIGINVDLLPGASQTYQLTFTRPATARFSTVEASARIPATTWTFDGQTWMDDAPRIIPH